MIDDASFFLSFRNTHLSEDVHAYTQLLGMVKTELDIDINIDIDGQSKRGGGGSLVMGWGEYGVTKT